MEEFSLGCGGLGTFLPSDEGDGGEGEWEGGAGVRSRLFQPLDNGLQGGARMGFRVRLRLRVGFRVRVGVRVRDSHSRSRAR